MLCSRPEKEIRVVFLDIRKAFDKVWHQGIIYKLSLCGIKGNLLKWFGSYLKDRLQRVVINGQYSDWANLNAGVPQGSVLGPLLFLIYINDITSVVNFSNIRLFADDTCLFIEVQDRDEAVTQIEKDLFNIEKWAERWLIDFAPEKTKSLTISLKRDAYNNPSIHFKGIAIEEVQAHTYLGLLFTTNLSWNPHISSIEQKSRKKLNMLLPLKFKLDRKSLEVMFTSFVSSTMYYAIEVWGGSFDSHLLKLEQVIIDGMRLVSGATARSNISNLYLETSWKSFTDKRNDAMLCMLYKMKNGIVPNYLAELLPQENGQLNVHFLRNSRYIKIPFNKSEMSKRSFLPTAITLWNKLGHETRELKTLEAFKSKLKASHKIANVLFFYGKRWPSIHHARLRIGCSKLNYDLCFNLHIPDTDPSCSCGARYENAEHFLMYCPNYEILRTQLKTKVETVCEFIFDHLLYGKPEISLGDNRLVFCAVHEYIMGSARFNDV